MTYLDTSFLVDLLREARRHAPGPATQLLDQLADEDLWVSVHVLCELFAGVELLGQASEERQRVERLRDGLSVSFPDERFAPVYGKLLAHLDRAGQRIGTMDLLIATTAVVGDAPLVTRNLKHFERVPGLDLITY